MQLIGIVIACVFCYMWGLWLGKKIGRRDSDRDGEERRRRLAQVARDYSRYIHEHQ